MAMSARGLCLSILCLLSLGFGASCSGSRTGIAKVPSVPVASISGTVRHVLGNSTFPLAGAQVCVEGTTNCTSSASDGSYALGGIAVGPAYLSAEVAGYLPGETRTPIVLTEVDQKSGIDIILSGKPSDSATYVGSAACQECHVEESLWHSSAHFRALDRTAGTVDVTGWPAEPATCAAPATADSGNTGANPTIASPADPTREVYLVRWHSGCGAGKPPFAMAFDTNQDGSVGAGDTIIPLNASIGGVATDVGQCGNGGILPANAPCVSNLGGAGTTNSIGWWQQEYLTGIGGPTKPAWVTWDTSGTPNDLLVMPLAWNQRSQQWVAAPDYNTSQTGTWSKACAGCHEVGLTLAADANGNVTQYSSLVGNIGCEKCHGPASDHVANLAGDARFIVNPKYLKADAAREVCAQCHSQGVASASPAGVYGFAWNDQASVGGGNFIPGVHKLSEFMTAPSFGDSDFYWPAGFPSSDHLTAIDFGSSAHVQDAKLTCGDCHPGHALGSGGPRAWHGSTSKPAGSTSSRRTTSPSATMSSASPVTRGTVPSPGWRLRTQPSTTSRWGGRSSRTVHPGAPHRPSRRKLPAWSHPWWRPTWWRSPAARASSIRLATRVHRWAAARPVTWPRPHSPEPTSPHRMRTGRRPT